MNILIELKVILDFIARISYIQSFQQLADSSQREVQMDGMSPLVYLQKQFGQSFFQDWKQLSDHDKDILKGWAREEMHALGIPAL